jgi:hypothetical protein
MLAIRLGRELQHMGEFIQPDRTLEGAEDLHETLGIPIRSGYRAIREAGPFLGRLSIFDRLIEKIAAVDMACEDQCSINYYFDLVRSLRDLNGEYDRVIEVGTFMGGASVMLAGCSRTFDFDLDLVDISAEHLQFTYERIRRSFPEATERLRLYHGDLQSYVRDVMLPGSDGRALLHHDGSHMFDQVVHDLTALSFVREQLHSIIVQDTHLRGPHDRMIFVDMALASIFGTGMTFAPIGKVYDAQDSRTSPDRFAGHYFRPGMPEGMVLSMAANTFQYPHPSAAFDSLFPRETEAA